MTVVRISSRVSKLGTDICTGLMALILVGLPFSSFPLLTRLAGSQVAPLSALPALALILVWLLPYLWKRGRLPAESVPLFFFFLACLAGTAGAFFLEIPLTRDRTLIGQIPRTYLTLAVGLAFYFAIAAWPRQEKTLERMLQAITIGGILSLAWGLMQSVTILFFHSHYPKWIEAIRDTLVYQQPVVQYGNRVTGFTYEPSWFAHQMNMLFLPLWLASFYLGISVFRFRIFGISVETILLGLGLVEFVLCLPRIGMIAFGFMLVFLFIKFNRPVYRRISAKISARWKAPPRRQRLARIFIAAGLGIVFILVYAGIARGLFSILAQIDWRMALLIQNPLTPAEAAGLLRGDEGMLIAVSAHFAFAERVIYWLTGWHIFSTYPWLGIGIGNTGFLFAANMPAPAYLSIEMRQVVFQLPYLANTKSLWVRLLAETGIVGFSIFVSWLVLLWRSARASQHSSSPVLRLVALAGQLALVAFLVEGFSVDSFALPYLWTIAALIAAAGSIYRAQASHPEQG